MYTKIRTNIRTKMYFRNVEECRNNKRIANYGKTVIDKSIKAAEEKYKKRWCLIGTDKVNLINYCC